MITSTSISLGSLIETKVTSFHNDVLMCTSYDTKMNDVTSKIQILTVEVSERIKENKDLEDFINESFDIISKKHAIWHASLDSYQRDDDRDFIKFNFCLTKPAVPESNNSSAFNFDDSSTSVYNEILDALTEKSDETIKSVILDESLL